MSKIEIDYDDLSPAGYEHIGKLQNQEAAVRRAVAGIGRSCSVRWLSTGAPTVLAFRLVTYGDTSDCIAEFRESDFDLDSESFAQLILAGQRPGTADVWGDDEELEYAKIVIRCSKNGDKLDADIYVDRERQQKLNVRDGECQDIYELARKAAQHFGQRVYIHLSCRECFQDHRYLDPN